MTMTDDLARIAEVLEDSATRATNAVQRQIINNNALAIRDAKARIEALTADNARLKAALTGIKKAAAHRMQDDPKDLHSYYFHTAAAALSGKEPSHE